jgi:type IV secretory pathway TrbF-like protein
MQSMNALSYLSSIEIPLSNKDDEYAQNVADFVRHIMRKVKKDAEIDGKYVLRLRDLLYKYGVYWGVNRRQVDRIAKWINSHK